MQTIGLVARKGGVGKTTLSINLAQMAAEAGETVVLIDMDQQQSAWKWREKRKNAQLDSIPVVRGSEPKLAAMLQTMKERGATMVFIDTRPDVEGTAKKVCELADFVMVPTGASSMDIEGVQASLALAREFNTPWGVAFNRIRARSKSYREAHHILTEKGARVAPKPITERDIYQQSIGHGKTAWEGSADANKKAGRELKALWNWLGTQLKGEN